MASTLEEVEQIPPGTTMTDLPAGEGVDIFLAMGEGVEVVAVVVPMAEEEEILERYP